MSRSSTTGRILPGRSPALLALTATAAAVALLAGPSAAPAQERLAVLPFRELGEMKGTELGSRLGWIVGMNLAKVSAFSTLEQDLVEKMLAEMEISADQAGEASGALDVGARLGVRWLVLGSVSEQGGDLVLEGGVLDLAADTLIATEPVRGPAGETFAVADRLSAQIAQLLTGERARFGVASPVRYDTTLTLTPADLARYPQIQDYAILFEDPELGWSLGAQCMGVPLRSCSVIALLASVDLRRRSPTRGVDGLAVVSYSGGAPGSVSTYYPEVQLEDGRKLILEVEPRSAIVSEQFFNIHRPEPQRVGARQFEIHIRVASASGGSPE